MNRSGTKHSNFTKTLAAKLIDHIVDEPTVITLSTQVCNEALRKLEFKLGKQIQILEKELRSDYMSKVKGLEESLKKEIQFFTLQNSVKKGIDGAIGKRNPSFVPAPSPGLDEMQVIKICKETFGDEYNKRMVQYNMDLTQEIDEVERAKALLRDETESQRRDILNAIQPALQALSRVSMRTVEKTHTVQFNGTVFEDEQSPIKLSDAGSSQAASRMMKR